MLTRMTTNTRGIFSTRDMMITIEDGPHSRRITLEIEKVQTNIINVQKITREAIQILEKKKRSLRKEFDPNASYGKEAEEIEKQILDITGHHDYLLHELTENQAEVLERKSSIDQLDKAIAEMDREIARIQDEHDKAVIQLEQKKQMLKKRLSAIEKLDLLINVLTYKIFETQHDYRKDMEELLRQREELLKRTDLTQSQIALELAELDRKIADRKNMHEAAITNLEGQRTELRRESALKSQHMDASMDGLRTQHNSILSELEAQKIGASPSEVEESNRRIEELNKMFEKDTENLKRLQEQGWKDLDSEEKLSALLEARGVRVTPSGHFLTASGRHLSRSEASCLGLLEGIEPSSWNSILQGHRDLGKSETSLSQESSTTGSTHSRMSFGDTHYLKSIFGKPLTLALAEITAKQPRDPIHYLGHWLFKYRYNQEIDVLKKQEIRELIEERERLEKAKLHSMFQDEARAVLMDLAIRAEEEAIRNELERIAREAAMLEEGGVDPKLEAEAKDVLGVYDGPTAGQIST